MDRYGSIINIDPTRKALIVAYFLIGKILVGKILLQPEKYAGIKATGTHLVKENMKFIGAVA